MPHGPFSDEVARSIERLTGVILLPNFFVDSGLNTRLGQLLDPALLGIAAIVIALAFVCKAGACSLATRLTGASWRGGRHRGARECARPDGAGADLARTVRHPNARGDHHAGRGHPLFRLTQRAGVLGATQPEATGQPARA